MNNFFIFLLATYYCISIYFVLIKDKNKITFSTHNVFALIFLGVYSLLFPFSYYLTEKGFNTPSFSKFILSYNFLDILLYYIVVFVVTHSFLYVLRREKNCFILNKSSLFSSQLFYKIGIIFLIVGCISDFLYFRAYGGYIEYLKYADAIRSGVISVYNKFSFLTIFREFTFISSIIFFSLIDKQSNKKSNMCLFLFLISFVFSMRTLISNRGRLSILLYFLVFIVFYCKKKWNFKYFNIKVLLISMLTIVLSLVCLMAIGNILGRNISTNIFYQLNKELSFVFVDFKATADNLNFKNARFLLDIVYAPCYLLPSSVWIKMGITPASKIMTIFTSGFNKGSGGVYGEMPIDLISLSYMQFGIFGVFIIPVLYAFAYKIKLEKK